MKQEIEDDKMTRNKLNEEDTTEANLYQTVILNKVYKDDIKTEEMIHWSILSDLIKYIDKSLDMAPSLNVKPLDYRQHKRLYNSLKTDKDQKSADKGEDRQATIRSVRCYNSIHEGRRCSSFQ